MRISIYRNVKTDREYGAATGLSKVQCEGLAEKFKEYHQVVEWELPQSLGMKELSNKAKKGCSWCCFKELCNIGCAGNKFWGQPRRSDPVLDFVQVNSRDGPTRGRSLAAAFF
jgi:hypothetical protein